MEKERNKQTNKQANNKNGASSERKDTKKK